jgi:protein TonB
VNPNAAPVEAPEEIIAEPPIDTSFDRALVTAVPGGVVGGIIGGVPDEPPPPPPPPEPIRVGGNVQPPTKTRDVPPVYPAIAQTARVGGVVIIEAVIGTDGRVQETRLLRSIPLLDQAALDAVRQWEYTPTTLNGVAVPVIMTVTVNFTIN